MMFLNVGEIKIEIFQGINKMGKGRNNNRPFLLYR